jgi:hypothetical protein
MSGATSCGTLTSDFGELPSGRTSASSVEPTLRVEDSRAASMPFDFAARRLAPGGNASGELSDRRPRQRASVKGGAGNIHFPLAAENRRLPKFIEQELVSSDRSAFINPGSRPAMRGRFLSVYGCLGLRVVDFRATPICEKSHKQFVGILANVQKYPRNPIFLGIIARM